MKKGSGLNISFLKCNPSFYTLWQFVPTGGSFVLILLRLFDGGNHDISNSADELDKFAEVITCVFVNEGVFHATPRAPGSGDDDVTATFITERVHQQTQSKCVFRCGDKQILTWGLINKVELHDLLIDTRVAASLMLERVRADSTGLRRDFACFAARRLAVALGIDAASGAHMQSKLSESLQNLSRVFKLDNRVLQLEYFDAIPVINKLWQAIPRAGKTQNALQTGHCGSNCWIAVS
jgi:hypothetical protein